MHEGAHDPVRWQRVDEDTHVAGHTDVAIDPEADLMVGKVQVGMELHEPRRLCRVGMLVVERQYLPAIDLDRSVAEGDEVAVGREEARRRQVVVAAGDGREDDEARTGGCRFRQRVFVPRSFRGRRQVRSPRLSLVEERRRQGRPVGVQPVPQEVHERIESAGVRRGLHVEVGVELPGGAPKLRGAVIDIVQKRVHAALRHIGITVEVVARVEVVR